MTTPSAYVHRGLRTAALNLMNPVTEQQFEYILKHAVSKDVAIIFISELKLSQATPIGFTKPPSAANQLLTFSRTAKLNGYRPYLHPAYGGSDGCGILVSTELPEATEIVKGSKNNSLAVLVPLGPKGIPTWLTVVYGPNTVTRRETEIAPMLQARGNHPMIWAGDWNCITRTSDCAGCNVYLWPALQKMEREQQIIDVADVLDKKFHTRVAAHKGTSRLDRVYANAAALQLATPLYMEPQQWGSAIDRALDHLTLVITWQLPMPPPRKSQRPAGVRFWSDGDVAKWDKMVCPSCEQALLHKDTLTTMEAKWQVITQGIEAGVTAMDAVNVQRQQTRKKETKINKKKRKRQQSPGTEAHQKHVKRMYRSQFTNSKWVTQQLKQPHGVATPIHAWNCPEPVMRSHLTGQKAQFDDSILDEWEPVPVPEFVPISFAAWLKKCKKSKKKAAGHQLLAPFLLTRLPTPFLQFMYTTMVEAIRCGEIPTHVTTAQVFLLAKPKRPFQRKVGAPLPCAVVCIPHSRLWRPPTCMMSSPK